jgi:hypothetical protein
MKIKLISIIIAVLTVSGCATPNVGLQETFWQDHKQRVVVASGPIPRPNLYQQGQAGLLEVAVNEAVTDQFQQYLSHYPLNSVANIRAEFSARLKAHQMNVSVYNQALDVKQLNARHSKDVNHFAAVDFTPFVAKVGLHKLLIISVEKIGAERQYYSIVPIGAPKAVCALNGRLVDLHDNRILWRYRSQVVLSVKGNWNHPPSYPEFSKTLEKAISLAKQELLDSFFTA